jgi:hypothetical protein
MKKIIALSVLVLSFIVTTPSFAITKTTVETEAITRPLPATPTACVINYFGATPSVIAPGSTSSIRWETTGCNHVMIDGVAYATNGSLVVGPLAVSKFHTLTAYANASGCGTETCPFKRASVVVVPDVCPNMTAVQVVIPQGMIVDAQGHCVQTTTPRITVTSPNGGEVYQTGQQIAVTWDSTGLPNTDTIKVLVGYFGPGSLNPTTAQEAFITSNTHQATFTLPTIPSSTVAGLMSGNYYKIVVTDTNTSPTVADWSDSTFTIQTPTIQTCTIDSFSANPTTVYPGGSSTLSWDTTGCNSVVLTGPALYDEESLDGTYTQNFGSNVGTGSSSYVLKASAQPGCHGSNYSDVTGQACAYVNSSITITIQLEPGTLPAGCTSTSGYSTTTGLPCSGNTTTPPGCGNGNAYSPITGQPCGRPAPSSVNPSPVAIATASPNASFLRELKLGTSGADVTALQNRLKAEGVYTSPITGYFGTMTQAAVKRYQTKYGIPAVGAVGPRTLQTLNK